MKIAINSRLYLYAALLLFLASCKLDQPDFAGYHASDSTGKTGGTGTTTSTGTYQPVTKGSYWTYNYVLNGATDTVTTIITGNTSMINGRKYYEGISAYKTPTFPGDTGYFSKDDHIYTNLSTAGGVVVELYYLNDTTAVGHGWSAPINATGSFWARRGSLWAR